MKFARAQGEHCSFVTGPKLDYLPRGIPMAGNRFHASTLSQDVAVRMWSSSQYIPPHPWRWPQHGQNAWTGQARSYSNDPGVGPRSVTEDIWHYAPLPPVASEIPEQQFGLNGW